MALSSKVQELVKAKKWKEAYDSASLDKVSTDDNSYLVLVTKLSSDEEGYLKGDATNYSLVDDAEDATSLSKKEAKNIANTISDKKQIKTLLIKRSDVIQEVGSQGTEKGEVIDLFLEQRYGNIVNIESAKGIITKWIEELGIVYNNNYLLQFMDTWIKRYKEVNANVFEIVNDLYANDEIDERDLQAKTSSGIQSILFNRNLYEYSYEDVEFIMQTYKWLKKINNIKSYMTNPEALKKYSIEDITKIDEKKLTEIRNSIIFKTPENAENGVINSSDEILDELRFFESDGDDYLKDDKDKKIVINKSVINSGRWKELFSNEKLTAQEAQDLINYLAKEFKLV